MSRLSLKVTPSRIGQGLLAMLICLGLLGCSGGGGGSVSGGGSSGSGGTTPPPQPPATPSFVGASGKITHDADGNLYYVDTANSVIRKITPAGILSTFAGTVGLSGINDGSGAAARFFSPSGITIDAAENLYVADTYTIRKITPAGVVSTLSGAPGVSGTVDGTGTAARFNHLSSITIDSTGNLFATDTGNYTIRKITPAGVASTFAGTVGVSGTRNGAGTSARFISPNHIVSDAKDNLYLLDSGSLRKITPAAAVTTPPILNNQLGAANSIMLDAADNIYLTNSGCIKKLTPANKLTTIAGNCTYSQDPVDGTGAAASFNYPDSLTIDPAGNLFVSDQINTYPAPPNPYPIGIGRYQIRKITPTTQVTTIANLPALIPSPSLVGITADASGNIFAADAHAQSIYKIAPNSEAVTFSSIPNGQLQDITSDPAGNIYVYATGTNPAQEPDSGIILKLSPSGTSTTFALLDGSNTYSYNQYTLAMGIAIDPSGNLFVSDNLMTFWAGFAGVASASIRKISAAGAVSDFAGSPQSIIPATAGSLSPNGLVSDASGNLYVADTVHSVIRKIDPAGNVSTFAGQVLAVPANTDGTDLNARFGRPTRLTIDPSGNLYVLDADAINPATFWVRKITPTGEVSTIISPTSLNLPGSPTAITFVSSNTLAITTSALQSIFMLQLP